MGVVAAPSPSPLPSTADAQPQSGCLTFSKVPTKEEIVRARVFEVSLVPVGDEPSAEENSALAAALAGYAQRKGPDDFSALTGFLDNHPVSPWRPALLTGLGLEYYNTAHYSLALDAWRQAWACAKDARDSAGNAVINRAVSELADLYARLGRMRELEALLQAVEGRLFVDGTGQKITGAKEGLWTMKHQPEVAFRCGPLALQRIKLVVDPAHPDTMIIHQSASSQNGFSLPQVAELSREVGLNYQMAFREKGATFIVPSVVHWKVGHYAAMVRQEGNRYLVEDPTFGNSVWATRQALEEETSGYFLIPPGELPHGWRSIDVREAEKVWGKGATHGNDPDRYTCRDMQTSPCGASSCHGMAVSSVHLMLANLQVRDTPVGYRPPVGPPVWFTVRYNSRDAVPQGAVLATGILGVNWTHDWVSYIQDQPQSPLADVKCFAGGGGVYTFTGFDPTNQAFALQQYEQTLLQRTGSNSYELVYPDGSKKIFAQPDGSVGSKRSVYLTQVVDAFGNAVTLTYNAQLQLTAITDALGQVTTLTYGGLLNYSITRVTDPFGRFATFDYVNAGSGTNLIIELAKITDVQGLVSEFHYYQGGAAMQRMVTAYGTNTFTLGEGGGPNGTTRFVETLYPDGSRERVEYNQGINVYSTDPSATVPTGMNAANVALYACNTYYWNRNACATAYGDYLNAKVFHWLKTVGGTTTSGMLHSTREPLENRVWYDYPGQSLGIYEGSTDKPSHVGRVLDDGSTQLYTYGYNGFGRVTNYVDPAGRRLSFVYATNGIDLLEVRQTRGGNNELLSRRTYNGQHRPLTITYASGQTYHFTYNVRGQPLTASNPKGETVTYTYDSNGYVVGLDGPLPGTNDMLTAVYDAYGRARTLTGVDGYSLTFDYDALDRPTRVTYPDGTFNQYTYDLLNLGAFRDRAGRITTFEHNNLRQVIKRTDPLGQSTRYDWCRCGSLRSLTDPMGRTTTWLTDMQGRYIGKQYADGSIVKVGYENTTSRPRQFIDENQQIMQFNYNTDDTLASVAFANSVIPTTSVSYTYDTNYARVVSMTDGTGTTLYSYIPVTETPPPGAGQLASVDGPLPNDTITYAYDELSRPIQTSIDGVATLNSYDAAGRIDGVTNALGSFQYTYDAGSGRRLLESFPNGQTMTAAYGDNLHDRTLHQISYAIGAAPVSQFTYGRDIARRRITDWSQQAGAQTPSVFSLGYDEADQLLSAAVTNAGALVNIFAYAYDPSGNRLAEQVGTTNHTASYNSLNEISTTDAPGISRTNEWDAAHRLSAVSTGNQRTELTYDGLARLVAIRQLVNGSEVSRRHFVWCGGRICEERDAAGGNVTKRYFPQGMKVETGPASGSYFYTRDHLGSVRELTDSAGNVRARYAYDPYGRRTLLTGNVAADFGFAGMFWSPEAGLALTRFRAYDPELGRWLSRDPLGHAEVRQGPNLYAYVGNDPIDNTDPLGLCTGSSLCACLRSPAAAAVCAEAGIVGGATVQQALQSPAGQKLLMAAGELAESCAAAVEAEVPALESGVQDIGLLQTAAAEAADLVSQAPQIANAVPQLANFSQQLLTDPGYLLRFESTRWFVGAMDDMRPLFQELSRRNWTTLRDFIQDNLLILSKVLFELEE